MVVHLIASSKLHKKKTFGPEYKSSCGVEGPTMFSLVTLGLVTIPN
jgi:hypothetical protein